jgi:hypothetical protein
MSLTDELEVQAVEPDPPYVDDTTPAAPAPAAEPRNDEVDDDAGETDPEAEVRP